MTLRVTLEIVPYGNERLKYEIFHANISNIGQIKDLGFGHQICKYKYEIKKPVPPVLMNLDPEMKTHYTEIKGEIAEHDRRDGAWSLVGKMIEEIEKGG